MSLFVLPPRWTPLRYHPVQNQYINSVARFNVIPAGRRSGKTELGKRKLIRRALYAHIERSQFNTWSFFAAAPTRDQAKRIYWADLKALTPPAFMLGAPSESDLTIRLVTGASVSVIGMDKPERVEGSPWDGGLLDEYGNMKSVAWSRHVRPALSDRLGWCDLIGVPEGRNHYYDLWQYARTSGDLDWAGYHWLSADILPPSEIEAAKRELDELSFQQEYEGSFVTFSGRAYYPFDEKIHYCTKLSYSPALPLIVCFDFNVSPGVAVICQEQQMPGQWEEVPERMGGFYKVPLMGTGVIGEVHIPQNSNTPAVCRRVIQDWGDHRGPVLCYGDATGGARGTAKVAGSDWELIRKILGEHFGEMLEIRVPPANPPERVRVNSVNSRLLSTTGIVRMMVDPQKCPKVVRDFEGVRVLEGGSGEIDKKIDARLTHPSDAVGYYIVREFPVNDRHIGEIDLGNRY